MPVMTAKPRIALKNILFPTDFSERSAAALPYAAAVARCYQATVYVAHVTVPEPAVAPAAAWDSSSSRISQPEMAILDRCDLLNGIPYETLLEKGEIWEVLSEMIRERDIDLIVVGTHGRGGFKKLILGSVAEEIIREAPCPVMGVGPQVPSRAQLAGNMRHILLATDFGGGSLAALKYAVSFAEENRARLTVVHVVDHRDAPRAPNEDAFQLLLSSDLNLVSPPDLLVKSGAPAEVILELAAEMQSDLIVVGVHETPAGALSTRAAWPTLHRLLCEAQSPVLTVSG